MQLIANFLNHWYWYLLLPIAFFALITIWPTASKFMEPVMGVLGQGFAWLLKQVGLTIEEGFPDIIHPARTLIFVLALMGISFTGGYMYHDNQECPAVSEEVRKNYRLVPRQHKTIKTTVKNWLGF